VWKTSIIVFDELAASTLKGEQSRN